MQLRSGRTLSRSPATSVSSLSVTSPSNQNTGSSNTGTSNKNTGASNQGRGAEMRRSRRLNRRFSSASSAFLSNRISEISNIKSLYSNTTPTYWVEISRCLTELYAGLIQYYDDLECEFECCESESECDFDFDVDSDISWQTFWESSWEHDSHFYRLIRISAQKALTFKLTLMEAMVEFHFDQEERYAVCLAIKELDAFLWKAGVSPHIRDSLVFCGSFV